MTEMKHHQRNLVKKNQAFNKSMQKNRFIKLWQHNSHTLSKNINRRNRLINNRPTKNKFSKVVGKKRKNLFCSKKKPPVRKKLVSQDPVWKREAIWRNKSNKTRTQNNRASSIRFKLRHSKNPLFRRRNAERPQVAQPLDTKKPQYPLKKTKKDYRTCNANVWLSKKKQMGVKAGRGGPQISEQVPRNLLRVKKSPVRKVWNIRPFITGEWRKR